MHSAIVNLMQRAHSLIEPNRQTCATAWAHIPARRGFTLVELSIVLVLLGLLVGGILAGQSLIRSSELRAIVSDHQLYNSAATAFQDKYDGLPGDIINATGYWGAAHATPATCVTTATTIGSTSTCNGNGDNLVFPSDGSNESFRFWQQLVNAGFIQGGFSGVTDGSSSYSATATNSPQGKIKNSAWFAWNWGVLTGSADLFAGSYQNFLEFGGITANLDPRTGILTPQEAWNIDSKLDDGKPARGSVVVRVITGLSNGTTTASNDYTNLDADYLGTSSSNVCNLVFRDQF